MAPPHPPPASYAPADDDGAERYHDETDAEYHGDEYHDDEPVTTRTSPPFLRLEDEESESVSPLARSPSRLPNRLRRAWNATARWVKGPQPPRPWRITPIFEEWQTLPVQTLDRFFPKRRHKATLLVGFYAAWLLTFSLMLKRSAFATEVEGFGSPVNVGCLARFW
jgi:hypothetical protein